MNTIGKQFNDSESKPLLLAAAARVLEQPVPKGSLCLFATPSYAVKAVNDYWEVKGRQLIRHHVVPRRSLFTPSAHDMPEGIKRNQLSKVRSTRMTPQQGRSSSAVLTDDMSEQFHLCHIRPGPGTWTGTTEFIVSNVPRNAPTDTPVQIITPAAEAALAHNDSKLRVKFLDNAATLPVRGTPHAAGLDITSTQTITIEPGQRSPIKTGLAVACPSGTYARIAPRSGLALKHGLAIGAGVVDADYRGEVTVLLINHGEEPYTVSSGDRIAQLVLEQISNCSAVQVPELPDTVRGDGGFGSTGTKGIPACVAAPVFAIPATWKGIKRVNIEFCTYEGSELCKDTVHSKGCFNLRCTKSHDMTAEASVRSLLAFVAAVPRGITILLWSGIPCTGGSPIQNSNKHRHGHRRKMLSHLKLWHKLYASFLGVASAVLLKGGHLTLEWPSRCRYWKQPGVTALLAVDELAWSDFRVRACAHGQLIESGKDKGKALTKVWRIASTIPGLDKALGLPCPGNHEHVRTSGSNTLHSGKYPAGMAEKYHTHSL